MALLDISRYIPKYAPQHVAARMNLPTHHQHFGIALLVILTAILIVTTPWAQQQKELPTVLILDFKGDSIAADTRNLITETFRETVFSLNNYALVNREEMNAIFDEQKLQLSGVCDTTKCYAEVGGAFGAKYLVSTRITKTGARYTLRADLIDNTSLLNVNIVSVTYDGTDIEGLLLHARLLAYKICSVEPPNSLHLQIRATTDSTSQFCRGDILIEADRENSLVLIDDKPIEGKTPLMLERYPCGQHVIIVVNEQYAGSEIITLHHKELQKVHIQTEHIRSRLKVVTHPIGATVLVDGKSVGTSPLYRDDILTGSHKLTILKEGYRDEVRTITVIPNDTTEISLELVELGLISITGSPEKATILFDGVIAGPAPMQTQSIPYGEHTVSIEAEGYYPFTKQVTIDREHQEYRYRLDTITGFVDISCTYQQSEILIDGKTLGTGTLTQYSIPIGRHSASCNYNDLRITPKTFEVAEKVTTVVKIDEPPLYEYTIQCSGADSSPSVNDRTIGKGNAASFAGFGGTYRLGCSGGTHEMVVKTIALGPELRTLTIDQVKKKARLTIASEPDNAQLFIDGQAAGTTPLTFTVKEGRYRLEAKAPDCTALTYFLNPQPGDDKQLVLTLAESNPSFRSRRRNAIIFTTVWYGLATATLLTAGTSSYLYLRQNNVINDHRDRYERAIDPTTMNEAIEDYQDAVDRKPLYRNVALASFGITALSTLVGSIGYAVIPVKPKRYGIEPRISSSDSGMEAAIAFDW